MTPAEIRKSYKTAFTDRIKFSLLVEGLFSSEA
jgi:hypothetical protein